MKRAIALTVLAILFQVALTIGTFLAYSKGGVLAAALLLLPAWGVHRRILAAKQAEFARVREVMHRGRQSLLESAAGGSASPGRMADIVAYEARVASIATWPFDLSTLVRFALYVALGLGSWLGAAMVERLVSAVLG